MRAKLKSGCLVLGDKGWLLSPGDYADADLYIPQEERPKVEFVKSPGHFVEFANAIKGEGKAMSNFPDYSVGLTETVLLGNLAVWAAAGDQGSLAKPRPKTAAARLRVAIRSLAKWVSPARRSCGTPRI